MKYVIRGSTSYTVAAIKQDPKSGRWIAMDPSGRSVSADTPEEACDELSAVLRK